MILVFKKSVNTHTEIEKLKPLIDLIIPSTKWNFDLDDCDKILRIDSEENVALKIKILLNVHSYCCEELD